MKTTSGTRNNTWRNLQLNAGVFLSNFDFSGAESVTQLRQMILAAAEDDRKVLGATAGGGSFRCRPKLRMIETDGMRVAAAKATVNEGWTVRMKGVMLEITPGGFKTALGMADMAETVRMKEIRARMDVKDSDFIERLCWVGDTSRGYLLIEMSNALNMSGAELLFSEQSEGRMPFDFQAHMSDPDDEYAPFRIVFLEEEEAQGGAML